MPSQTENHIEAAIREKRTNLAVKNNLMGPSGKFGVILDAFGTKVMRQGSGLMDVVGLNDPYEEEAYTEYSPTMSEQNGPVAYRDEILEMGDEYVYQEGLLFDGLSRGMHLDITYWLASNELKVNYKGYCVYHEIAGELYGYAPFPEWEGLIDKLFKVAKIRAKELRAKEEAEIGERIQEKKASFWEGLKLRWGL